MPQTYNTRDGDVVDHVAWRQYGACDAATLARVLDANPGLADYGAVLPAGVLITLPDIPRADTTVKPVQLWD